MLSPRKPNIAVDANALDHKGTERDALVDRFNALVDSRVLRLVVGGRVRDEVLHPRTPSDVKDAVLPRVFNLRPDLNASEDQRRRRIAAILQGNAQPETHAADAAHLSEAAETGCAYFITDDARILRKRGELGGVLPPSLKIVMLTEFFEVFDRFSPAA